MKKSLSVGLILLCAFSGWCQTLIPLERQRYLYAEKYITGREFSPHTAIKPWIENNIVPFINSDSALTPGCRQNGDGRKWIIRKLFYEHFLQARTNDFQIAASPLFNFQYGYDLETHSSVYVNTRGVEILGNFSNRISFYSHYVETQARFPDYVNDYISYYGVVPGMSRVKEFKGNAYDYGSASGWISYNAAKFVNIQLGHGKHFFGDGYRSLLLSDNAFQYPYLKIHWRYRRFEYVTLYAGFQNLYSDRLLSMPYIWYNGFQKKPATFNYLAYNAAKWMQIGLFESIIWKSKGLKDSHFNLNQFIPVILVNSLRYSLFSENNAMLGLNINIRPLKNLKLYGQWVMDDFHLKKPKGSGYQKDKYGFQAGVKYFDAAGIKNLILQAEYNQMKPYGYGHVNPLQSYTHYNQPLAHPLGANFRELVGFADYRFKRIYSSVQFSYAVMGADTTDTHWGKNIFAPDNQASTGYNSIGNKIGQGIKSDLMYLSFTAGFLFNPRYHLCVEAGLRYRNFYNVLCHEKSTLIWIGIKTNIFNQYFDF